jgi:hypothetical protein
MMTKLLFSNSPDDAKCLHEPDLWRGMGIVTFGLTERGNVHGLFDRPKSSYRAHQVWGCDEMFGFLCIW